MEVASNELTFGLVSNLFLFKYTVIDPPIPNMLKQPSTLSFLFFN